MLSNLQQVSYYSQEALDWLDLLVSKVPLDWLDSLVLQVHQDL
jgi:hypothetical protein